MAPREAPRSTKLTSLQQAIGRFLLSRQAKALAHRTVDYYSDELKPFVSCLKREAITDVWSITPDHIRAYQVELQTHRNPGGQHASFRAIRAFLRWFEGNADRKPRGWVNPITKVDAPKRAKRRMPAVSAPVWLALLRTCDRGTFTGDRDWAILLALVDSGLRASELLALDKGDITWEK